MFRYSDIDLFIFQISKKINVKSLFDRAWLPSVGETFSVGEFKSKLQFSWGLGLCENLLKQGYFLSGSRKNEILILKILSVKQ